MEFLKKTYSKPLYVYLLYSVVSIVVFGIVLFGDFVFDDMIFVTGNADIKSLSNFFKFFVTSPVTGAGLDVSNFYRPLGTLSFALIYALFGLSPFAYHLFPIILHTINSVFLFKLFKKLKFSELSAFFAGLLFLIHPAQTETISYLSGIADPLALFFIFLTFFALFKNQWRGVLFFLIALFSKEWAVVFLPIFVVILFLDWKSLDIKDRIFRIKASIPIFLITLSYIILKFTVLDFTGNGGLATGVPDIKIRLITFVSILFEYAKILFLPVHLYIERPYAYFYSILTPQFFFGFFVILLGILITIQSYRKNNKFALGFLWIAIAMIPFTNIVPLNAIYMEHWLYMPIIGFLILFAATADKVRNKKLLVGIMVVVLLLFGTRSIVRNLDWVSPERFYKHELQYNKSARIYNNLAMHYAENSEYEDAIDNYNISLSINNSYPQTYHNLAQTYRAIGRHEEAEQMYKIALLRNPNFMHSYVGLYNLYISLGNTSKAQEMLDIINSQN